MRRVLLLFVTIATVGMFAARGPLLEGAARLLIEEDAPTAADVIVILAGSAVPDRVLEGATLYRAGFAPRIVLSRELEWKGYAPLLQSLGVTLASQDERNRSVLDQMGVPADAVAEVGRTAESTFAEAREILAYAGAHGYRTILLVTSKLHSRRAAMIYRRLAGDRFRIVSRPSRHDRFQPDGWWRHRSATRRVVVEYEKMLVYLLLESWRAAPLVD